MQNVYNKHNLDDPFKYELVCTCERKDLATLEKSIYDDFCRKYSEKISMNLANCGVTNNWTESMKKKASVSHKGKVFTEEHCKNISIVQLSLEGELIKIWDSPVTVQEELGIHVQMNRKSCGGFQWQKYEDWKIKPKGPIKYSNIQEVYQYSKNGDFIRKYKSIQEASDLTGIRHSSISNAVHGRNKTGGGFIWKK